MRNAPNGLKIAGKITDQMELARFNFENIRYRGITRTVAGTITIARIDASRIDFPRNLKRASAYPAIDETKVAPIADDIEYKAVFRIQERYTPPSYVRSPLRFSKRCQ